MIILGVNFGHDSAAALIKDGEIINSGNHSFLIQNCSEYKSLYKKQLK